MAAIQLRCFGEISRDEWIASELLIVENALSIPMDIPLGLAIRKVHAETGMRSIGYHHDFFWERQRFIMSSVDDHLDMAFPPRIHAMNHVVINSEVRRQLGHCCGPSSVVIPNGF